MASPLRRLRTPLRFFPLVPFSIFIIERAKKRESKRQPSIPRVQKREHSRKREGKNQGEGKSESESESESEREKER